MKEKKKQNRILRKISKDKKKGKANEEDYNRGWENFVQAKKNVNKLVNAAIEKDENKVLNVIRDQGGGESRDWYQFIKGKSSIKNTDVIRVDGKSISDVSEIKKEIEIFWGNICGDKVGNFKYTCDIDLINGMREVDIDISNPSMVEIRETLKSLKNNKGAGIDGIPYEFFKFGGEWAVRALFELYKQVWVEEVVPAKWNESRVILLHKGGNKSKQLLKNYRPISLGNTMGKIFCSIINERFKRACDRSNVIGEEQNGFRRDRRGEDNIYIMRELIDRHNREKKTLYIGFLDIEKAYDRVNRDTLTYVLKKIGFPSKIYNIINSMYRNTKSKFTFGEIESDWVKVERGVRQGCVLSPLLFSIYTEELAARVRDSGLGIRVKDDRLGILLYADDVVILAENEEMLQKMLKIVNDYGNEFSLNFNSNKCGIMILNKPEEGREDFRLGNEIISRVRNYTYLGVLFDEGGTGKAKLDRIFKANQWWGRLGSVTKFRSNKYEVLRGLWKSIAIPGILYAMNVINWNIEEINKMEVIQNKVGRLGLGANRMVGIEAIRGDMGWSSFEERIFKGELKYKIRLEKMRDVRWAKKVYLESGTKSKWNKNCIRIANKCGFGRVWVNGIGPTGEWRLAVTPGDNTDHDEGKWKGFINNRVQEYGLNKWLNGINNKSTLSMYSGKHMPKREVFYNGNWGSQLLFKARTNSLEINDRTYRFNGIGNKACQNCTMLGVDETLDHLMVECPAYEQCRDWVMQKYKETLGNERFNEVIYSDDNGLGFFLGLDEQSQ